MDTNERFDLLDSGMKTLGTRMDKLVTTFQAYSAKTDERLLRLEQDVAVIKSNYATKADVAEMRNSIVLWVVSAFILTQLLPRILDAIGAN
ncbi:hypothetical protein E4L96_19175 [Massilia arenosa]|uniref:Uncharacterized protein n=1 Tax=Zemynaea arenosa TaxID=2561931 RepID=A0A4Y9S2J9_9BURK|nr:hypothetical protein [Massilia arenosa]TFW13738.1 hypothetical protein E4L96_19175 [Massilia arenosa]